MWIQPTSHQGYLVSRASGRPEGSGLEHARMRTSLSNLQEAGWSLRLVKSHDYGEGQPTDLEGALQFITRGDRRMDRYDGDRLRLTSSDRSYQLLQPDEVASADYFVGTGSEAALPDVDLARRMKSLRQEGLNFEPVASNQVPRANWWGAYLCLTRGLAVNVKLERTTLCRLEGGSTAELDRALAPYAETLEHYRDVLAPLAREERLQTFMLGDVARALHAPLGDLNVGERGRHFVALLDAVNEGPDRHTNLADRTGHAMRLYEGLARLKVPPEELEEASSRLARVTRAMGAAPTRQLLPYLCEELPQASFYCEGRAEREETLVALLSKGVPVEAAVPLTEQIALCPLGEDPGRRREAFAEIARLDPLRAAAHLQNVLTFHRPGQDLEDSTRAYRALLEGLVTVGKPGDAVPAYRFLHEGLRLGRLHGTLDELISRYVQQVVVTGDPEQARRAMAGDRGEGLARIGEQAGAVVVGGVRVPTRRRAGSTSA